MVRVGGANREVPVYDPITVDYPALRTTLPSGSVVAFALAEPTNNVNRAIRFDTPEGIAALALDNPALEDFEVFATTAWPGNGWAGNTGLFASASGTAAIDETRSLRGTADTSGTSPAAVYNPNLTTARENRYSALVRIGGTGNAKPGIHANGQSTGATSFYRNSYKAAISAYTDTLGLERWEGGGNVTVEATQVTIRPNVTYHLALDMHGPDTTAILSDATSKAEIARATMANETMHTSGVAGVSVAGTETTPCFFDNIRREGGPPMGTLPGQAQVIDTFESASFAAYSSDDFGAFTFDDTVAREGSYSLRLNAFDSGDDYLWSMPGDGLANYPSVGDTFQVKYRTHATDANTRVRFYFAKQTDGTSVSPSYMFGHLADGTFYVGETTANGEFGRANANPGYPTGTWLRAEVEWLTSTSVRVTLYNDQTGALLAGPLTGTMTGGLTNGGIQFWAQFNRNGPIYFDDIRML